MGKLTISIIGDLAYSNTQEAANLQSTKFIGEFKKGKVYYNTTEVLYLVENYKAEVIIGNKTISYENLLKLFGKKDKEAYIKYVVYKDLREKGYVIKAALKFGGDFRLYEKGKNPLNAHSRWVVYPMSEKETIKMHELSSKNRVAHSTNKNVLLGIVDGEGEVIYYEIDWKRM